VLGTFLRPELVSDGRNRMRLGKPGRGKTHIAIAGAFCVSQNGYDVRFVSAAGLIDTKSAAAKNGRWREATAEVIAPAVLVADEFGHLSRADDAAKVLRCVEDQRRLRKPQIAQATVRRLRD
jgi:DNA replication protein DnaC